MTAIDPSQPAPRRTVPGEGAAAGTGELSRAPWDGESVERDIVRSLRRIIRAVGLYSRELQRRHDLTAPQLATLRQLRRKGALSAGELAQGIAVSAATVTGIVDRLEERGLVSRTRDPADRRRVLIALTDAGLEKVASSPPPLHERFLLRLTELAPEERAAIDRVLRSIVEMMEAGEVEAAPVLAPETELDR